MIKTSLTQLTDALRSLKLPANHVYIIHSSMLKFGIIEGGLPGVMNCLKEVLGPEATILMPTFTFSFGRSRVWDYHTSKSEVGALTEYFRKLPNSMRTIHPFHSLAVAGRIASEFSICTNKSSFGERSPFDLLYEMDAINISLGTEFEGGATFLHHTEEMAQVPYRYYKEFPGEVKDRNGDLLSGAFKMFVRENTETYDYDNKWDHVWDHFISQDLVVHKNLNGANLFAFRIKPTHDNFLKMLKADPFYCAKKTIKHQRNLE